jgi:hypothetical protein
VETMKPTASEPLDSIVSERLEPQLLQSS